MLSQSMIVIYCILSLHTGSSLLSKLTVVNSNINKNHNTSNQNIAVGKLLNEKVKLFASSVSVSDKSQHLTRLKLLLQPVFDVALITSLATLSGVVAAIFVSTGRKFITYIDPLRTKYPTFFPLLGSGFFAILLLFRSDLSTGPAFMFNHEGDSLTWGLIVKQYLRFISVVVSLATGNALGLAGAAAEVGITAAKSICDIYKKLSGFSNANDSFNVIFNLNTILLCGASGGFAANFDTPLAGASFALEVTSRLIPQLERRQDGLDVRRQYVRSFAVLLAAFASVLYLRRGGLQTLTTHVISKYPCIIGGNSNVGKYHNILILSALGIVSGVFGAIFNIVNYNERIRRSLSFIPYQLRPSVAALFSGASIKFIGESQSLMDGFRYIDKAILSANDLSSSKLIKSIHYFLVKYLALSISVSSGMIGGVVAPALFLGGSLGVITGQVSSANLSPMILVGCGMAAMFTSIMRAPMTGILVVLEMSRTMSLSTPLMVTVVSSMATTALVESMYSIFQSSINKLK